MPIKPNEFDYTDSRLKDMYNHLKSKGHDVYFPGQKVGDCKSKYIVVKNDGSYQHANFSTDRDMYAILCIVPVNKYSELEPLVQNIKRDMKDIYPLFMQYGQQTPSQYDDTIKAHYITIEYENYKKVEFM